MARPAPSSATVLVCLLALSTILAAAFAGSFVARASTTTVIDFETAANGAPTTAGQQLNAYPAQGVHFENTVEVVACAAGTTCLEARSGSRVVRTFPDGEFARHPFDVSFADPKDTATVYVRLDAGAGANGSEVTVVMNAYQASGAFIGSATEVFTHNTADGVWHSISMSARPDIRGGEPIRIGRVMVWGGQTIHVGSPPLLEQATNFLLFDDLTMQTPPVATTTTAPVDGPPPPGATTTIAPVDGPPFPGATTTIAPVDDPSPQVEILVPVDGAVVTAPSGADGATPLHVKAFEDSGLLDRVDLTITDPAGGESTVNLCGRSPSPACSPASPSDPWQTHPTTTILLTEGVGVYTLTATACDLFGNCANSVSVDVILDGDDPQPEVRALKVELNQGTQNAEGLLDVPGAGGHAFSVSLPRGTLIAGRDLVVRYYLVGMGGPRDEFSARLGVVVWRAGDSLPSARRNLRPIATADVPMDPGDRAGRDDLIWQMRGDLNQTLDFVVPAELLEDAVLIDLALPGVSGHVQAQVQPAVNLGLYIIKMLEPDNAWLPVYDDNLVAVLDHLKSSLPISQLLVPNTLEDRWALDNGSVADNPFVGRVGAYPRDRSTTCNSILDWVSTVYSGDTLPTTNLPDYVVTLGVAGGAWLQGCIGLALEFGPPTAISYADTNAVAQELVHTMGVKHAGDDHGGEKEGGGFEPWPYPHGIISPDGHSVFGILAHEDAGAWTLTLVAPCLTDALDPASVTVDCTDASGNPVPDSQRMHDFMSYGRFLPWTPRYPYFNSSSAFRWASDITYSRVYGVLRTGTLDPPTGRLVSLSSTADGHGQSRADAWIVSGVVREAGGVELFQNPVRKILPLSMIGGTDGPYTLELLDESGSVLERESFDASMNDHHSHDAQFWVAVPHVGGVTELRIQRDGDTIFELEASDNPPTVEVLTPNGGERFDDGTIHVTWEASDADGDELTFLVQYSPDNGESWQGVTLVQGPPYEAEVAVDELLPGHHAFMRVTASDGLNSTADVSDRFFVVGTDGQPGDSTAGVSDGSFVVGSDAQPETPDPPSPSGRGWWLIPLAGLLVMAALAFGILKLKARRSS